MSATRFDPFDNFKFRVAFDGKPVPGVSKVSALSRITDVVEYREGGENNSSRKLGGLSHFPAIVLERGLSVDTTFEDWVALVLPFPTGSSSGNFRKDMDIEIMDESGKVEVIDLTAPLSDKTPIIQLPPPRLSPRMV